MRIIIELTEAESRSTTIQQPTVTTQPATQASGEAPPIDGGPPPEALLMALRAKPDDAFASGRPSAINGDAGEPPRWLVDAVAVGPAHRFN
jgi:hypothetical protein